MTALDREEVANALLPTAEDMFRKEDRRLNEGWAYSDYGYSARLMFIHGTLVDIALLPTTDPEDTR